MLVGLGGKERTEDEHRTLLQGAGLRMKAIEPLGTAFSMIAAVRSP